MKIVEGKKMSTENLSASVWLFNLFLPAYSSRRQWQMLQWWIT